MKSCYHEIKESKTLKRTSKVTNSLDLISTCRYKTLLNKASLFQDCGKVCCLLHFNARAITSPGWEMKDNL
ncbi:CLUMA_CG018490, isoform A [Clunio marinus]|uniref:CLUMA_CG018490, isoform A n=1 Tax=Clunio marinus TaxID=568069 RepID=A0A1J1IY42_9DIPT|nr:CLUMA_CG018490, isoform A [Clunio marinus]